MRLIALILMLITTQAWAASAKITWTMPTETEDALPVPAIGSDAIVSSTIEYSVCGANDGFGVKLGEIVVAVPKTSGVVTVPTAGRYCFRAYVSTASERSEYSNVIAKVLSGSKPKAPTLVSVVVVVL